MEISHRRDNRPVSVDTDIEDLITKATELTTALKEG